MTIFAILIVEILTLAAISFGAFLYWLVFERFDLNRDDLE
jgi:hypothetical protein